MGANGKSHKHNLNLSSATYSDPCCPIQGMFSNGACLQIVMEQKISKVAYKWGVAYFLGLFIHGVVCSRKASFSLGCHGM